MIKMYEIQFFDGDTFRVAASSLSDVTTYFKCKVTDFRILRESETPCLVLSWDMRASNEQSSAV